MRPYVLLLLFVAIVAPTAAYTPDTLTITFLDVGHADSILVQAPNGHAMLVDAAGSRQVPLISAALTNEKITRLEYVVGTHGDADHIGGMVGVMSHVTVGQFVNNGIPVEDQMGMKLQTYLSSHAIDTHAVSAGDTLDLDTPNVTVTVLNPQADPGTDWDEASVVLRIVFGTQSFMLTGDAGTIAEGQILASGRPVASTVLKAGHHGLSSSTGAPFVAAVNPAIAVISQDDTYYNRSREVVQRLQENGATVYSTASSGTVRITATRTGHTVDTEDGPELPIIVPTPTPTIVAVSTPIQTLDSAQSIDSVPPVAIQPVSAVEPAAAPRTQTTAVSGKRYAVGSPSSYIQKRFGSGGTSTETGAARTAVATSGTTLSCSRSSGVTQLNNQFVRRYPAGMLAASST